MIILTIILAILALLNIMAFLLYYKRTKRILFRYQDFARNENEKVIRRIESRLIHSAPDFENSGGVHSTWAVMFTFDRKALAIRTVETLRKFEPELPLLVVDNGSSDGTPEALTQMLREGRIQKVLLNTHTDVPQWQKSFAFRQALKLLAMEYPSYIVWLDDDLEIIRPFLREGISLLEVLQQEKVKVINMTDNEEEERNHPTIKRLNIEVCGRAEVIKVRPTFNGQFNIVSTEFFREFGFPPIAEGISELAGEDWFYSRQLQN